MRLELSYNGFHPGCVKVSVWDVAAPSTTVERTLDVPAGSLSGTFILAVYRQASWSHTVGIRAAARELSCTGPEVAVKSTEVTVPPKASVPVSLSLVAADLDNDGYVAEANGGTDCRDDLIDVHPGAVELCNDIDDDCDGILNDGFDAGQDCPAGFCGRWTCAADGGQQCSATEVPWYPDLDHDSYGRADGGSVLSCGNPDGGYSPESTDCDDTLANVHPSAPEICDALDNDCDGTPDNNWDVGLDCTSASCPGNRACDADGGASCHLPAPHWYYPDFDRDTYGAGDAGRVETCGKYGPDAGMSLVDTDCNDQNARINPIAIEICDGIDDNCAAGIDEIFNLGGTCDGGPGTCGGAIACNGVDGGTTCNAVPAVKYYVDDDLDLDGRPDSGTLRCSDPGTGWADSGTDCDDGDPFTRPGKSEICDRRDNNCNGQIDEGGGTCPGSPGWTAHSTPGGNADDWETVAVYVDGGTGVWIASGPNSPNNVRTKRAGATPGTWAPNKNDCAGSWYGSWADPLTGRVYLVGSNNKAAYYDVEAANCVSTNAASSVTDPRGVVGYGEGPNAELYAVAADGKSAIWDGGQSWSAFPTPSSTSFDDVHGISPDVMFAVGGDSNAANARSRIYRFDPGTPGWVNDTPNGPPRVKLHSVWVVNSKLAYAVGSDPPSPHNFLVWDGSTWQNHPIPSGVNNLTGVLAFGRSRVWVIDDNGSSSGIYQYELDGGWSQVDTVGKSLRGIAGTSPADIWVVGWDGTVIHWPN